MPSSHTKRLCIAGSFTAAATLIALVPLNMGGCNGSGIDLGGAARNLPFANRSSAGGVDPGKVAEGIGQTAQAGSLSARDEVAIGQSVSLALSNKYGISNDPRLTRYIILVGNTVAFRTPIGGKWVFGVLDTDEVNAFSTPGRYVFVTRGAIKQMQDESELAGVVAHEVGHVNKHHGLQVIKNANVLQGLATIAQGASGDIARYGQASDVLVQFITENAFSAPQEFEADAEGVRYVAAAGYDPNGLLHFLQRIRTQQKAGFKLMSTHPDIDDRIKRISDQISAAGTGGHGATLRERFNQYTRPGPAAAISP